MPILVHFEDEGTTGTLLVVFKMHGLQKQKTGVSKKYKRVNISIYVCYYALAAFTSLTVAEYRLSVHISASRKNLNKRKIDMPHRPMSL